MATLRKRQGIDFLDYYVDGGRKRKAAGRSKCLAELALKDLKVKNNDICINRLVADDPYNNYSARIVSTRSFV